VCGIVMRSRITVPECCLYSKYRCDMVSFYVDVGCRVPDMGVGRWFNVLGVVGVEFGIF